MPRGDVVAIADRAGDFTSKPRPAVIVQHDVFDELASITICPLTSFATGAPLLRLELTPSETLPLDRTSWIEADKITTVPRNRIGRTIGRLTAADLVRLNGALAVFLGLG